MPKKQPIKDQPVVTEGRPTRDNVRERMLKRGRQNVTKYLRVDRTHTGDYLFDEMLGGGLPEGVTMLYGNESSGKSLMCNLIMGAALERNESVLLLDTEGSIIPDPTWYARFGITKDTVDIFWPQTGEEALDLVTDAFKERWIEEVPRYDDETGELIFKNGQPVMEKRLRCVYDLVVVDSIAALVFQEEADGGAGDSHVAISARKNSEWIRKVDAAARLTHTRVLIVNHVSTKIGVMGHADPEHIPGGAKLRFMSKVMVRMANSQPKGTPIILRCRTKKNKTAPARREAEIVFWVGDPAKGAYFGPDVSAELVTLGKRYEVLLNAKGGPWTSGYCYYGYDDEGNPKPLKLGEVQLKSADMIAKLFDQDPALRLAVERDVKATMYAAFSQDGDAALDDELELGYDETEIEDEPAGV